eukprot:CAMPEP_0113612234 /NCGR_PEP_ID=MMETSP0017_2-20120614/5993_1 /TAXON_ID=2856 /ORGANISM="Cylindrotheca closterium" /LENGTH=334 /DNA_ID=CAMNT_0000521259 /DNA_START=34 /DNA_END=1035 /DNA_ORIENTATION=+ /assembly_acc=CAM_ASM_000147
MNKYSRFLSFAGILVCLTPLGGVYTLLQTFPWMSNGNPNNIKHHGGINAHRESFQSMDIAENRTCVAQLGLPAHHLMGDDSHKDSQDPIRYDAGSFLDTPIDTSYRTNTTRYQRAQQPYDKESPVHSYQQGASRSLHQREQQPPPPFELDPLMFHVRNNEFYNHFNQHNNHVLLLSWTLSLLLGLLVPVFALLYDAYLRITSKSRHQKQLQAIQKALKPYKRKVLTKSQTKESCPVCLSHFAMGESILTCGGKSLSATTATTATTTNSASAGCSHCFHQSCMVQWLLQQTKHQPNQLVGTILSSSNAPAMSTLQKRNKRKLDAPCPCCRQPFVT